MLTPLTDLPAGVVGFEASGKLQGRIAEWPRLTFLLSQASSVVLAFRRNIPAAFFAFTIALIGAALNALALVVLALSLKIGNLSAADYMIAAPLSMLANALPLTPGGLGVGEVAFDQICTWLDAGSDSGAYASIFFAFRAVSMLVPLGSRLGRASMRLAGWTRRNTRLGCC